MPARRPWLAAEIELLHRIYADMPSEAIARALGRPVDAVCRKARTLGLRKSDAYLAGPHACRLRRGDGVGASTRFQPGLVPWNKGTSFFAGGRNAETRFRPGTCSGRAAQLVVPVGSYRVNADGYLDRKVTDEPGPQNLRWKAVHRLVWEAAHGPVPAGHVVVFRPGRHSTDAARITLDALELVTRQELMRRNSVHRHGPEIARLHQLRGALVRQINKRAKEARQP